MLINREQQRVIDEVEQNILLLASAGTGKTNTLAYRGSPHRGRLCEGGEHLVLDLYEQGGKRDERPHSIARRQSCKGCGG